MKKRFLSLALALVMCLGLTVQALAADVVVRLTDNLGIDYVLNSSSNQPAVNEHWNWSGTTLSLANLTSGRLIGYPDSNNGLTINLTGTSNLYNAFFNATGTKNVTFSGSGTCIFYEDAAPEQQLPFSCDPGVKITLKDGLVMTGGPSEGDSYPLTFQIGTGDDDMFPGLSYLVTPSGQAASYVCIAPGSGSGTTTAQPSTPTKFTDVSATSPYLNAIKWAVENGVTKGKTATTFGPNDPCIVRHIIYFLGAVEKVEDGSDGAGIWDWAIHSGLIQGDFDEYGVPERVSEAPCTRSMAVTYMWKVAGSPTPKSISSFSDVPTSASYAKAVSWALEQGITTGTTPQLSLLTSPVHADKL